MSEVRWKRNTSTKQIFRGVLWLRRKRHHSLNIITGYPVKESKFCTIWIFHLLLFSCFVNKWKRNYHYIKMVLERYLYKTFLACVYAIFIISLTILCEYIKNHFSGTIKQLCRRIARVCAIFENYLQQKTHYKFKASSYNC